jgi:serine/threonine protein kinase
VFPAPESLSASPIALPLVYTIGCRTPNFFQRLSGERVKLESLHVENFEIAKRWCATQGADWSIADRGRRGGTASVFTIDSPLGQIALKIYDRAFSSGEKGEIEQKRVEHQLRLGVHDCPYLVKIFNGGQFENRLFVLMSRAPGRELEKCLSEIPRSKIRSIVDQMARACLFLRSKGLCHRDIKSANIFISDDFGLSTLLDVSVMRDIHDPVGLGTDHGDQLPVVATARYSPPEYLFRLLEPGPALWHAVDVYQLGGLLHDLIMREPLFEAAYQESRENKYRFAWTVATTDPIIEAGDVDPDLVFVARRALDKSWERRSTLTLQDFLAETETEQARALSALGLSRPGVPDRERADIASVLRRVTNVAAELETFILRELRSQGATATHFLLPGSDDRSKLLRFVWRGRSAGPTAVSGEIEFALTLRLSDRAGGGAFECSARLTATIENARRERVVSLPAISDDARTSDTLQEHATRALSYLAAAILRTDNSAER